MLFEQMHSNAHGKTQMAMMKPKLVILHRIQTQFFLFSLQHIDVTDNSVWLCSLLFSLNKYLSDIPQRFRANDKNSLIKSLNLSQVSQQSEQMFPLFVFSLQFYFSSMTTKSFINSAKLDKNSRLRLVIFYPDKFASNE